MSRSPNGYIDKGQLTMGSHSTRKRVVTAAIGLGAGVDHSNRDPAHEAGESASVAAAEAGGKGPGGDHHSNTDPAHEASESAARTAQEATNDAALPSTTVAG